MQSQNDKLPMGNDPSGADDSSDEDRMWYVRLRIRDDRLAKLWVWKLAEHDAIVWSESEDRWKKLLAIPELRAAVRQATASAFARKRLASELPPAPSSLPESGPREKYGHTDLDADYEGEELTTRVPAQEDEDELTRRFSKISLTPPAFPNLPGDPQRESAPPVDPVLRALTSSRPPTGPAGAAPAFPRAPRVPSLAELAELVAPAATPSVQPEFIAPAFARAGAVSEFPSGTHGLGARPGSAAPPGPPPRVPSTMHPVGAVASYVAELHPSTAPHSISPVAQSAHPMVRPSYVVAQRVGARVSIKNISWALMPIACAGVFALFLDRYLPPAVPANVGSSTLVGADPASSNLDSFGAMLGAIAGMSLGRPAISDAQPAVAANPPAITPEQLARVTTTKEAKASAPRAAARSGRGAGKASASEGSEASGSGASAGAAQAQSNSGFNESFDRDGARTALRFAVSRVRNCSNSGFTGSALITFLPAGTVQKVQISQLVGDDVDTSCVTRALSGTRVPPFTGAPVTVRKSF